MTVLVSLLLLGLPHVVAQAGTITHSQAAVAANEHGKTVTVHSRGTGAKPDVDLSLDDTFGVVLGNPYRSEIWPLPGHLLPYNLSEGQGVAYATLMGVYATKPGYVLILSGYSQGAGVAGDAAEMIYKYDLAPNRTLARVLWSDPRLYETGVEVVLYQYASMLPLGGWPLMAMRGERATRGEILTISWCARYDFVCNTANPGTNPGGTVAGLLGYAMGGHDHRSTYRGEVRTVVSDNGMTVVKIIENQHPVAEIGEILRGKPLTEAQNRLIHEAAPVGDPGSAEQPTPEPLHIAAAAADVTSEIVQSEPHVTEPTPEAIGQTLGATTTSAVTQVGAVVQDVADTIAPAAAPVVKQVVEQVATGIGTAVADEATRFLQGFVPAVK